MFGFGKRFGKKGSGGGNAPGRRPGGASRIEHNVIVLADCSGSVEQSALDYVFQTGLPITFEKLRSSARDAGITYKVCVLTFSSEVKEILPFSDISSIAWDSSSQQVVSGGVTCMEDAMWEAFARIDAQKAKQDARKVPRSGSMVIVVTDGRPTDECGVRKPLSAELVAEIKERNSTRATSTFVIGMGSVDDETLLQLGPVTCETLEGGQLVEAARAVRYVGGDYQDTQCWGAVCSLIGKASSSSTEDVYMVDEETAARLPELDSVFVPDAGFAVVK